MHGLLLAVLLPGDSGYFLLSRLSNLIASSYSDAPFPSTIEFSEDWKFEVVRRNAKRFEPQAKDARKRDAMKTMQHTEYIPTITHSRICTQEHRVYL